MHTQSQPPGLQLLDVNTSVLDPLVLDYLAAEDFLEVKHTPGLFQDLQHVVDPVSSCPASISCTQQAWHVYTHANLNIMVPMVGSC